MRTEMPAAETCRRQIDSAALYDTLLSYDVTTGTSTKVADKVWTHFAMNSGSKIIYNDNAAAFTDPDKSVELVGDIKLVDLSVSPLAPKTLQLGADVLFFLTPDSKTLIYRFKEGTAAQNGIYALPMP